MSSWFNFDFFVCWMQTQLWNLNLYKQTKCSLAARSHIPTQNSNVDWQVGLRNLKPLFTWQKILHRQFVTKKYYFRYTFVFTWKKSRWSVLKILGTNFLGSGPLHARAPGQVLPLSPLLDANDGRGGNLKGLPCTLLDVKGGTTIVNNAAQLGKGAQNKPKICIRAKRVAQLQILCLGFIQWNPTRVFVLGLFSVMGQIHPHRQFHVTLFDNFNNVHNSAILGNRVCL